MEYIIYSSITTGAGAIAYIYKKFPDISYKLKRFNIIRHIKKYIEKDDLDRLECYVNKLDNLLVKYKVERRQKLKMVSYNDDDIIKKKDDILKNSKINYNKFNSMISNSRTYNSTISNSHENDNNDKLKNDILLDLKLDIRNILIEEIRNIQNKKIL